MYTPQNMECYSHRVFINDDDDICVTDAWLNRLNFNNYIGSCTSITLYSSKQNCAKISVSNDDNDCYDDEDD